MELTFFAGGDYDLKRWALSFGPDIEVLEPDFLRHAVADELCRAAELYRSRNGLTVSQTAAVLRRPSSWRWCGRHPARRGLSRCDP